MSVLTAPSSDHQRHTPEPTTRARGSVGTREESAELPSSRNTPGAGTQSHAAIDSRAGTVFKKKENVVSNPRWS